MPVCSSMLHFFNLLFDVQAEDDAVHFYRTLVHITLKEFIIHNAAFEHQYSAIVMSTDLLQLAIFLFNELLLCLFLDESIYF